MLIDYTKVICPHCGKRHFEILRNNVIDVVPAIFKIEANPEWKDGVLLNPSAQKPYTESFKCKECDHYFDISVENVNAEYQYRDITEEQLKAIENSKDEIYKAELERIYKAELERFTHENENLYSMLDGYSSFNNKTLTANSDGDYSYVIRGDSEPAVTSVYVNSPSVTECSFGYGDGDKIELSTGIYLNTDKTFTDEQIKNIENLGFNVIKKEK